MDDLHTFDFRREKHPRLTPDYQSRLSVQFRSMSVVGICQLIARDNFRNNNTGRNNRDNGYYVRNWSIIIFLEWHFT